ncbi:unnamed protein product [Gordionus sp. m RMFG-2023]
MKNVTKILIAGTPGTGKSTLIDEIIEQIPNAAHIDISKFAKDHNLIQEYDNEYDCHVLDEERLIDELEENVQSLDNPVIIFEYHGVDLFPKHMLNAIFILRTDNTLLYDRLNKRAYNGKKLEENLQSEIFQTILDEAKHYVSGNDEITLEELISNTPDDMEINAQKIINYISE